MRKELRGVLNVKKPSGISSYDVIRTIKRVLKNKVSEKIKIGHAGTLDPLAKGVLLILFNEATKIGSLLSEQEKEYIAEIRLGIKTDTDDITGKIIERTNSLTKTITQQQIENVLKEFIGEINQIPPTFSALRQKGGRLYNWARAGKPIQPKARTVFIYELELLRFSLPFLIIRTVVAKGTYIRALARDIGDKLNIGATLNTLIRTRIGSFNIKDSLELADLTLAKIEKNLCSIADALPNFKKIYVPASAITKLLSGQAIKESEWIRIESGKGQAEAEKVIVLDEGQKVMAIANYTKTILKPSRLIYADLPKT